MRILKTPNEFFDMMDQMGDNKFVTIGYVTSANLDMPKVKRVNPSTNRMKSYDDYTVFGNDDNIGALVKITSYNMRYRTRSSVSKQYGEYKKSLDDIRASYGLEPTKTNPDTYTGKQQFGAQGISLYKDQKEDLAGHAYYPQNTYGARIKSVVYAVNDNGNIVKELTKDQILPYLKAKGETSGVSALRKMGAEEEKIQEFIQKVAELHMNYRAFEANSILWIAATINGEKVVYINERLNRVVNDININPQDFIAIAKERYQKDLNQLQESHILRMTDRDFYRMINESVKRVLSESGIEIDPENKGKFTATKKRTGKSTEELTHSKNPLTRKRAVFAKMAKRGWKPLKK